MQVPENTSFSTPKSFYLLLFQKAHIRIHALFSHANDCKNLRTIMNWALWLSFATISAVNIVTPGPANLNTVRRAIQLGVFQIAPTILGNALGLVVGGAICAAGITSVVMASDLHWYRFQWVGVAYLAWLGVKLLIRKETLSLSSQIDVAIPCRALFLRHFYWQPPILKHCCSIWRCSHSF
jgi:hypothetical protein